MKTNRKIQNRPKTKMQARRQQNKVSRNIRSKKNVSIKLIRKTTVAENKIRKEDFPKTATTKQELQTLEITTRTLQQPMFSTVFDVRKPSEAATV